MKEKFLTGIVITGLVAFLGGMIFMYIKYPPHHINPNIYDYQTPSVYPHYPLCMDNSTECYG